MTIIALVQTQDGFDCYADSLVSFTGATRLEIYCKVLILPVSYRWTQNGKTARFEHKLGMAISGNLAAATAVYTILSGVLQSLHSHQARRAPKISDIINLTVKVASEVYEGVRALDEKGLFGFFIFGHEIEKSQPFAYRVSTEKAASGQYEVIATNVLLKEGQISVIGSGSDGLRKLIVENNGRGPLFPDLFYQFVKSGSVPSVGGMPQMLLARPKAVTIEPVVIGSDDGLTAAVYHSGLNVDGYNTVGDYMVGLQLRGFNMDSVHRAEAIRAAGYDPSSHELPVEKENQAVLQWFLRIKSRHGEVMKYDGVISISEPDRFFDEKYLSYACKDCGAFSKVLHRVPHLKSKPFKDDLFFKIRCNACGADFLEKANSFSLHTVR